MTHAGRVEAYRKAYLEANGSDILVSYAGGWFRIGEYPSVAKMRKADIENATAILRYRAEQARAAS